MARQGKIARLPHALREQVNVRLLNGESAATVLQWLNAQPAAVAVFKQLFNGEPATEQNLSNWRQAGYAEWLARREKTDSLKTLSAFALDLSKAAGGTIADGAAAITAGHLLEALEALPNLVVTGGSDDAEADPIKGLIGMANAVSKLQKGQAARDKIELDRRRVKQTDQQIALARDKFEKQTVSMFMKWAASKEAQAILTSGRPQRVQMTELRELMFGKLKSE